MTGQPDIQSASDNWEDESSSLYTASGAETLGITRFLRETYVVDGYTYTSLADAMAQSSRSRKRGIAGEHPQI